GRVGGKHPSPGSAVAWQPRRQRQAPARYDMEEPMHDHDHTAGTPPRTRRKWARAAAGLTAAAAVLVGGAIAAFAAGGGAQQPGYGPAIKLVGANPRPGGIAQTRGDFTASLQAPALNATRNRPAAAAPGHP